MTLTRSFPEIVVRRAECDAVFRAALLGETRGALQAGETDIADAVLRDCLGSTTGDDPILR